MCIKAALCFPNAK